MDPSALEFITVGQIVAPWGIKGKLKVEVLTDFPGRFSPSSRVYIERKPMTVQSVEWHRKKAIIKLDGIDGIEDAERLKGQPVEIHRNQIYPLPEGEYYHFQLIGLEVRTTQGKLLGNIAEILTASSNDAYVVCGAYGNILIPAIEDVVKSIDLDRGLVVIEPIEGLLSLNQKGLA